VMDSHHQRLEKRICLLLLLEALVRGDVGKVNDLAFDIVEYQWHPCDDERLSLLLLSWLEYVLHGVGFDLLAALE